MASVIGTARKKNSHAASCGSSEALQSSSASRQSTAPTCAARCSGVCRSASRLSASAPQEIDPKQRKTAWVYEIRPLRAWVWQKLLQTSALTGHRSGCKKIHHNVRVVAITSSVQRGLLGVVRSFLEAGSRVGVSTAKRFVIHVLP